MNKIPILSFFSGGGFLDMGFEQAGFEVIWANEIDSDFIELNNQGMGSWRKSIGSSKLHFINNQSISILTKSQIIEEAFGKDLIPTFGIIGGPPCQDFSMNGKQKGFGGERGKLTIDFIEKISCLSPGFFVIENVPGLIRNKNNKIFYNQLLARLENEYVIKMEILNSLNFGVPQSRQRLFTVGFKRDLMNEKRNELSFNWPKNQNYDGIQKSVSWPKLNTFGCQLNVPSDIPLELCVSSCLVDDDKLKQVPNSEEYFILKTDTEKLKLIQEGETCRPSFKRLHRYRYSPTTCYGNNEVHLHPFINRRISVREALRIQGVSDSYILNPSKSLSKKFKMIGNGVPVPLARALGESILKFINSEFND